MKKHSCSCGHKHMPKKEGKMEMVMDEYEEGKLPMGKSSKMVKNRKQAVAIGLAESRKAKKKTK